MHPLDGALLKLKWANDHFYALQQTIQNWRDSHPYEIDGRMVSNKNMRQYLLTVKENIPIPAEFSLMVGDICNNARSALDYALWQLWLLANPAFNGNVYFPNSDSLNSFSSRSKGNIGGLTSAQKAIIERLQPYNTGDKELSILRDLNNSDKHRIIQLFAVSAKTEIMDLLTPGGGQRTVGYVQYRIAERVEVKDGAVVAQLDFLPGFIGTKVDVNAEFSYTLNFNGSHTANGLNVDPTLQSCIYAVHEVLTQLESQFPGTSTIKL